MHIVIFEGQHWKSFLPAALSRPIFSLSSGSSTLLQKQIRHLKPTRLTLWVRPELEAYCRDRIVPALKIPVGINTPLDDEPALISNGRALFMQDFEMPDEPAASVDQGILICSAYTTAPGLSSADVLNRTDRWLKLLELPQTMPQTRLIDSLWDLINWNEESLIEDAMHLEGMSNEKPAGAYHTIHDEDLWFGKEIVIQPGVVLNASKGPIVIGDQVTIGANSVLEGPCYIGAHTRLSPLCIIRAGTTIGTMCKIGGEVSNSIIHGFTNKSHYGFIGDSYIGKWVNIGAGTTTSNLKNTYGEIMMHIGSRKIPTGRRFLGSLIGDHAKIAINTDLMAGSYFGFSSHIVTDGYAPQFVPSYGLCSHDGIASFHISKAIEVAQRVFARRNRQWTDDDTQIMNYVSRIAPQVEQ